MSSTNTIKSDSIVLLSLLSTAIATITVKVHWSPHLVHVDLRFYNIA